MMPRFPSEPGRVGPESILVFVSHAFAISRFYAENGDISFMKRHVIAFIVSIMMLLPACRQRGPELGAVKGTVTLDGRPLTRAIVIFEPKAGGRASRAVTDASGRYQLVYLRDTNGALVGSHIVKIFTASEDDPKERIPARYNKQSTLTADVAPDANEHNFSLSSR
jgi:hypothetical protein